MTDISQTELKAQEQRLECLKIAAAQTGREHPPSDPTELADRFYAFVLGTVVPRPDGQDGTPQEIAQDLRGAIMRELARPIARAGLTVVTVPAFNVLLTALDAAYPEKAQGDE